MKEYSYHIFYTSIQQVCHSTVKGKDTVFIYKTFSVMLWTIAVILLVLWLLGVVTSYTIGGFIHVLLVIAIIVVLIRIIRGENPIK